VCLPQLLGDASRRARCAHSPLLISFWGGDFFRFFFPAVLSVLASIAWMPLGVLAARYSVYLLYWYKITNTDAAAGAAFAQSRLKLPSIPPSCRSATWPVHLAPCLEVSNLIESNRIV